MDSNSDCNVPSPTEVDLEEQTVPQDCSTPAPLQDASMDNSTVFGYRCSPTSFVGNVSAGAGASGSANGSANGSGAIGATAAGTASGGNTSPGHRQSVRDYDEQLSTLRRENFNLKLRIYFLEENVPPNLQEEGGKEAMYKQNVDLKVETEALRAELKEKQALICEAATALQLFEQSQRNTAAENAANVAELQQRIAFLELEVQTLDAAAGDVAATNAASAANSRNMSEVLARASANSEAQLQIAELEQRVAQFEALQAESERLVAEAETRCAEQETLLRAAEEQYTRLFVEHNATKVDASTEAEVAGQTVVKSEPQEVASEVTQKLRQELADRECEVLTLDAQLQAKTLAHENGCKALQLMIARIRSLEAELSARKSTSSTNNSTTPQDETTSNEADLQQQLDEARKEARDANAWRLECNDVCTALTIRLKELAEFLDTLLRNKEVLSVLANDRRKVMRRAVDSSLNLTNSLHNISVSGERYSMLNDSLSVLGNLSTFLATTGDDCDGENKENQLPADSRLSHGTVANRKQQEIIDELSGQVQSLRYQLEIKNQQLADTSSGAKPLNISAATNNSKRSQRSAAKSESIKEERLSESDACWSEPDRQVSQARIGLDESASLHSKKPHCVSGDSSVSSLPSVSGSPVASSRVNFRIQEECAELRLLVAQKENRVLKQQCFIVEMDNQLREERLASLAARNELAELRQQLAGTATQIAQLSAQLESQLGENQALTLQASAAHQQSAQQLASLRLAHEEANAAATTELAAVRGELASCQGVLEFMRESEAELQAQIADAERQIRALKKSLDEAAIQSSKAVLERTKAMADKRAADAQRSEAQRERDEIAARVAELNKRNAQLERLNAASQNRLVMVSNGGVEQHQQRYQLSRSASSGTASRAQPTTAMLLSQSARNPGSGSTTSSSCDERQQRLENSSPDLGIESDAGRTSGSDGGRLQQQQKRANLTAPGGLASLVAGAISGVEELRFVEDEEESQIESDTRPAPTPAPSSTSTGHDCAAVDREIVELKRKLASTHQAHRQILQQLRVSNSRKEQVERDIRREICKTHTVLQTVRTNIESAGVGASHSSQSPPRT